MKKRLLILLAFLLAACGAPNATAPATPLATATQTPSVSPTPLCPPHTPTQAEVNAALNVPDGLFDSTAWEQNHTAQDNKISVVWQNIPQSAVVYLEENFYPCGNQPNLNDTYWDALFANYAEYQLLKECAAGAILQLAEFKAVNQGFNYHVRYWFYNAAKKITTTMMIFPFGSEAQMDQYALQLFPKLPYCPAE
ncbi:MAG: hypothetical protein IT310_01465 [Anaerolineales bacterium]|nr:hypothetical protein [Anaerolineales bacterium]